MLETFVGVVAGGDAFAITAGGLVLAAAEPPCSWRRRFARAMSPSDMGAGLESGVEVDTVFAVATAGFSAVMVDGVVVFGGAVCDGTTTGVELVGGVAAVGF